MVISRHIIYTKLMIILVQPSECHAAGAVPGDTDSSLYLVADRQPGSPLPGIDHPPDAEPPLPDKSAGAHPAP